MKTALRNGLGLCLALATAMVGASGASAASSGSPYLTEPSPAPARAIALDYLVGAAQDLGVAPADVAAMAVVRQFVSRHNGLTHLALRQTARGIEIDGTDYKIAVDRYGRVFHPAGRLLAGVAGRAGSALAAPRITADEAVVAAAAQLGHPEVDGLDLLFFDRGAVDQRTRFASGAVSEEEIPVALRYLRLADDSLRLTWNLSLKAPGDSRWWNVWVDAGDGELLRKDNWTNDVDTYSVFASPKESPLDGPRTSEVDPYIAGGTAPATGASPFGWHDTNGALGVEFTDSRGNNVEAQTDLDANNVFGGSDIRASGGAGPDLNFLPALDLNLPPSGYREAAVVNLYYWNNILHDVTYQYGFDEASGNFQFNNYGRGGVGGDPVQADAQDGSGTNNANFSTPADGLSPRMQMFVWSAPQNIHENSPTVSDFPAGSTAAGWGFSPPFSVTNDLVFVNDGVGGGDADNDGCQTPFLTPVTGKIALIRRGNCEFGAKALNAQNQGAVGTIIINNGSNGVAGMGPGVNGASVTTPTQMIGRSNGNLLVAELGAGAVNVTMSSTAALPDRDSDLDNGVIAHEYGHGISNRLTGTGPGCLGNQEQMGEGWSDWMTLFLNALPSDTATGERSVGGYVSFEPANTPGYIGIRTVPYTTDLVINPQTYASLPTAVVPHGVGTIWAQMLWEVYWNLVNLEGYDADIYNGDGGNNVAFQLVMDGLKLQPCLPGFEDGRDAILAADVATFEGNHQCEIWRGFAKRGMGASADQGLSTSIADGTPASDLPAACVGEIFSDDFSHGTLAHWDSVTP
jgi:extracellular elastinolytic metalloproteinase